MPYERNDELPAAVRKRYTAKQQRAFRRAYNDAARRGLTQEQRFRIAHAAARRAGDDTAGGFGMDQDQAQKDKKKGYRKTEKGSLECVDEECDRIFATEAAAEDHALAVHSHDEIRQAIAKALRAKFFGPPRTWAYVESTADDWFVYSLEVPGGEDKLYRQGFEFSDGEATLTGDPVEVRRRVVYEPIQSQGE